MLVQADEADDDDAEENGAPDGDHEGGREKYVGVKVKVWSQALTWTNRHISGSLYWL